MTADDARKLTASHHNPDPEKIRIVLDLWYAAIQKAAANGENAVSEGNLSRVRTPIPGSAWIAAIKKLREDGFDCKQRQVDRDGSSEMIVSWGVRS